MALKDSTDTLTFFRDYNKEVGNGDLTLVGNWVEERALRHNEGTGRYKQWARPDNLGSVIFSKSRPRPDGGDANNTFRRTMLGSEYLPASEYATSNAPASDAFRKYVEPEVGARERNLRERAMEEARNVLLASMPPPERPDYVTETKAGFPGYQPSEPLSKFGRKERFGEPKIWETEPGPEPMVRWHGRNARFSNPIQVNKPNLLGLGEEP